MVTEKPTLSTCSSSIAAGIQSSRILIRAAVAVSGTYRLGSLRFANALATAASFAAGLQQALRRDSMSKPLHAGRAAEGGLPAAQMGRLNNYKIELIQRGA